MTVYIDKDFKCHVNPAEGLTPVDDSFFDGKCDAFIEGHRFIPHDETWVREDGKEFAGRMISPWKPSDELDSAQRVYEKQLLAEYEAKLTEMEANSIAVSELEAAYQEGVNSAYD